MSPLSDQGILELVKDGALAITPWSPRALGPASIDLQLSRYLVRYPPQEIALGRQPPRVEECEIGPDGFVLEPGAFVLAMTFEHVRIPPTHQAFLETKGDAARAGLQVHSNDGHVDAGTDGHLTLELTNLHRDGVSIRLFEGSFICQLFIWELSSPTSRPYAGKYAHQTRPTPYIP